LWLKLTPTCLACNEYTLQEKYIKIYAKIR